MLFTLTFYIHPYTLLNGQQVFLVYMGYFCNLTLVAKIGILIVGHSLEKQAMFGKRKRMEDEPDIRSKMKFAELNRQFAELVRNVKSERWSNDVLRAHINESEDDDIRNTFFTFLKDIDSQAIKLLIENGVDVDIKHENGNTPINQAIEELHTDLRLCISSCLATNHWQEKVAKRIELIESLLEHEASIKDFSIPQYIDILNHLESDTQQGNKNRLISLLKQYLLDKHYYKLSSEDKDTIKNYNTEKCNGNGFINYSSPHFKVYEKIDQMLSSDFKTIYEVVSQCNQQSKSILKILEDKKTIDQLNYEVERYQQNYEDFCDKFTILYSSCTDTSSFAILPPYNELVDYIIDSIKQVAQAVAQSVIQAREREIRDKAERNGITILPRKTEQEGLKNKIVLYAEYMLSNILIGMSGDNKKHLVKIEQIAYKQTSIFEKELKKFNSTDLQNIVVASLGLTDHDVLGFKVSDVQGILENKVAK